MSTMVERVAREMCRADGIDPDRDSRNCGGVMLDVALPDDEAQMWRTYARKARRAIEAMREPTDEMVQAGLEAPSSQEPFASGMADAWRTMIDAALNP